MTWSPFFTEVTPGPTSTTTPAPSCPRIAGNSPSGSAPDNVNSSVWQTPVALISTRTSPAFGPSSSTSSTTSGFPASYATAARVFMAGKYREARARDIGGPLYGSHGARAGRRADPRDLLGGRVGTPLEAASRHAEIQSHRRCPVTGLAPGLRRLRGLRPR